MMQISHEQAQAYLQADADQLLDSEKRALLDSHLASCDLCRAYARSLGKLEGALRNAMQVRWNASATRLSMEKILGRRNAPAKFTFQRALSYASAPILVAAIVALALMLSPSRSSLVAATHTPIPAASALAAPTPSLQPVTASLPAAECEQMIYTVQPEDTLESIAEKFGVSMEAIREANPPPDADVISNTIIIPLCNSTPSLTPTTALTYTVTPFSATASHTP